MEEESWGGAGGTLADADERRVLFAALDSFRYAPATTANMRDAG